jgi:hypothetical protein
LIFHDLRDFHLMYGWKEGAKRENCQSTESTFISPLHSSDTPKLYAAPESNQ